MAETIEITITCLAHGGIGVGRHKEKVVFIPYTAIGDHVKASITSTHKRFDEARVEQIITPSANRATPACLYFGTCGGCNFQHINYESQVEAKKCILLEQLNRIGKIAKTPPVILHRSPDQYRYRKRFRMGIAKNGQIGFRQRKSNDILPVLDCKIAVKEIAEVIQRWNTAVVPAVNLPFSPLADDLWIIMSELNKLFMYIEWEKLNITNSVKETAEATAKLAKLDGISIITQQEEHLLSGEPYSEKVGAKGDMVRLRPDSFSQANAGANAILKERVKAILSKASPGAKALELYAGNGNLTLPLSEALSEITAVELDKYNVSAGNQTAAILGKKNVSFIASDVGDYLKREKNKPQIVITDPPRTGMGKVNSELVAKLTPEHILYVACDPAVLARDAFVFYKFNYQLTELEIIDMFPQTSHFETIALFSKQ